MILGCYCGSKMELDKEINKCDCGRIFDDIGIQMNEDIESMELSFKGVIEFIEVNVNE